MQNALWKNFVDLSATKKAVEESRCGQFSCNCFFKLFLEIVHEKKLNFLCHFSQRKENFDEFVLKWSRERSFDVRNIKPQFLILSRTFYVCSSIKIMLMIQRQRWNFPENFRLHRRNKKKVLKWKFSKLASMLCAHAQITSSMHLSLDKDQQALNFRRSKIFLLLFPTEKKRRKVIKKLPRMKDEVLVNIESKTNCWHKKS